MGILEQHDILVIAALIVVAITAITLIDGGITGRMVDISQRDSMIEYLNAVATLENQHVDEIPEIFRALFGNSRVNGTILMNSYELVFVGAIIENGKIIKVQEGIPDGSVLNPTVNVFTTESTIRAIAESSDPGTAGMQALRDGKIKYTPLTTGAHIQAGAIDLAAKVMG